MFSIFARSFVLLAALFWTPVICFAPTNSLRRPSSFFLTTRTGTREIPHVPATFLRAERSNYDSADRKIVLEERYRRWKTAIKNHHHFIIGAALLLGTAGIPLPCFAFPSSNEVKGALALRLDGLSHSGIKGMVVYALLFTLWTMTVGATTPIETAAGMAFPIQKSIPLSAIGKIGGAFLQYVLAKYLFADYARKKMKNNKWMDKINASFQHHPYRVALIWRFSPLPEFVKNIGPALVPTLRTPYQILALVTHGLPFTILWICIGNEAALVARGVSLQLYACIVKIFVASVSSIIFLTTVCAD